MVLQLFFTLAFSAVPLTLYVPPIRSLNFFVETMEDLLRESRIYTNRIYPRARVVWSRLLDCVLCSNMRFAEFGGLSLLPSPNGYASLSDNLTNPVLVLYIQAERKRTGKNDLYSGELGWHGFKEAFKVFANVPGNWKFEEKAPTDYPRKKEQN